MQTLSKSAIVLLRHRLETKDNRVTDANRDAYRELVKAGIMFAVSGFATGPEASIRFTELGWSMRERFISADSPFESPLPDPLPRG
jgi:hypothetical protein